MPAQRQTDRCDCGRSVPVMATASPYEFDWRCVCGRAGTISYAHASPPPVWLGEQATQGELFDGS
jgi:hypothetical protein